VLSRRHWDLVNLSCPESLGCCTESGLSLCRLALPPLAAKTGLRAVGLGRKERKPKQLMSWGNLPPAKHAEAKCKQDDTAAAERNAWLHSGTSDGKPARNFDVGSLKAMAQTVLLSVHTFF